MVETMQSFREQGFVILPDVLSSEQIEHVRTELSPHFGPFGRNPFEGEATQRAYALLAKAPSIATLVEHPSTLALIDQARRPDVPALGRDRDQAPPRRDRAGLA